MPNDSFHELTDRLGWVYDADSGSRIGSGRLQAAREQVTLEYLPENTDQHPPLMSMPPKEVPERLVFADRHGITGLDGCSVRRSSRKGRLPSWVEVHADHAIETVGANRDFTMVSNLRSEIAGLATWATLTPVVTNESYVNDDGLLKRIVIEAKAGNAKEIGTRDGLRLVPHFSTQSSRSSSGGRHEIVERMFVETRVEGDPVPLQQHLKTHRNMQELLVIAYGTPCGQRLSWVSSTTHPKRHPRSGEAIGDHWRGIISTWCGRGGADVPMELPWRHALFDFPDIGADGVRRWVEESPAWARTVGPLALWTFDNGSSVEVEVVQIAVALEALGHKIAVRQGLIRPNQSRAFLTYLRLIGETLKCDVQQVIKGSPENDVPAYSDYKAWSDDFNMLYKQSKHADHPLPDPIRAGFRRC